MSAVRPLPVINPGETIVASVRDALTRAWPAGLRAVVLTGSLARGEGTWLRDQSRTRLAGDAEFFAIFEDGAALPAAARIAALQQEIENQLRANLIEAKIGLSPVGLDYLRRLRPHIFAYELLAHGKVICGDPRILALAPNFSRAAIPLEDGFRLLVNRIIELIESLCAMPAEPGAKLPERVRHSAAKLWLDTATSFLLFQGQYESTYRARGVKLKRSLASGLETPIDAARFAERVELATRWKLGEGESEPTVTIADLVTQIGDVRALWRWELGRLNAASSAAGDSELVQRWIAGQPVAARLRGWAAVVKRHGLVASLGRLPRWSVQAMAGSPRYLIYAAASELFFALPAILRRDPRAEAALSWARVGRRLPLARELKNGVSWRNAGQAIAWNYHQFLESTRS